MINLNLNQTLSWTKSRSGKDAAAASELAMLNDLQGNIVKGHGRHYTSNLFVNFAPAKAAQGKQFLASVGVQLTDALHQLIAAQTFKNGGKGAGNFYALFLSSTGYDALGEQAAKPTGKAFTDGMKARPDLKDPPSTAWDAHFSREVHAMILIAAETLEARDQARDAMVARIAATGGAVVLLNPGFAEDGNAILNDDGNGIEHFGYVDGRSQPLALQEDLHEESTQNGGISEWDPAIPLSQLLVPCPGGKLAVSHGSYFVFRKLDQRVRAFKEFEKTLAASIETREHMRPDEIGERMGASVVGRFENGTPVTMFGAEQSPIPKGPVGVINNFNYSADPAGLKCPFAGHIRKSNPRGDVPGSKSHLMARRGIPYGQRTDDPNGDTTSDKPEGDVGLLFMAYQSSLEAQFEFTQASWVNNVGFARPLVQSGTQTGIDPLIGQPATPSGQRWPLIYGISETTGANSDDFSGFVTMRGGEYFFAPSISYIKSLS